MPLEKHTMEGTNDTYMQFTGTGGYKQSFLMNIIVGEGVPIAHADWGGKEYQVSIPLVGALILGLLLLAIPRRW